MYGGNNNDDIYEKMGRMVRIFMGIIMMIQMVMFWIMKILRDVMMLSGMSNEKISK